MSGSNENVGVIRANYECNGEIRANRKYKDNLFRMIFKEPKALLELYNAVSGATHTDENDLEIVTLENAIYMNMKNDVAFVVDCGLNLYEQQSSVNPNMPLRNLFYVCKEYQVLVDRKSLYASRLVKIPTPYFVVFYNGAEPQPERMVSRLSEAFAVSVECEEPALELKLIQLNIGEGYNEALKEKCPLLKQYVEYAERVRRYVKKQPLEAAVERAVQECIKEGILAEFLRKNRAEAFSVSIFEYDEEKEIELLRQAEREEGIAIGRSIGRNEGRAEGRAFGRTATLVELVCKKLAKKKDAVTIAEELEEQLDVIGEICSLAKSCDMDVERICELLKKQ